MPEPESSSVVVAQEVALQVGATIGDGRYRVLSKLGHGGNGAVYAAEDLRLHRKVAVKMLHESNATTRVQLMKEVELLASLHDPRVVAVTDVGQVGAALFMVTEFLEGTTLAAYVEEYRRKHHGSPIPDGLALRIGSAIAGALSAAHSVGYIHRDLKPANLMLQVTNNTLEWLKLIDFGLSARAGSSAPREGTPDYVAPETVESHDGDVGGVTGEGTDLYSLGCVLFELLSGNVPFPNKDTADLVGAHLSAPRPRLNTGLPELDDYIEQLMAKKLSDRPTSAKVVADRLLVLETRLSLLRTKAQAPRRHQETLKVPDMMPPGESRPAPVVDEKASQSTMRISREPNTDELAKSIRSSRWPMGVAAAVLALLLAWFMWPASGTPERAFATQLDAAVAVALPKIDTVVDAAVVVAPSVAQPDAGVAVVQNAPLPENSTDAGKAAVRVVVKHPSARYNITSEPACTFDERYRDYAWKEGAKLRKSNRGDVAVVQQLDDDLGDALAASDCRKANAVLKALARAVGVPEE